MRDDDDVPVTREQGVSRRRLLGGVGAGAAALTIGGLAGTATPASAAYNMKWGAVCSPPGDWATKVDRLRRMRPQTVRVSMYWSDPNNRRFANWQLPNTLFVFEIGNERTTTPIRTRPGGSGSPPCGTTCGAGPGPTSIWR